MAVMNQTKDCNAQDLVKAAAPSNQELGGQLAACLWIYTRAVICNSHKNMDDFRDKKRNSVVEAVSRVVPDHQWVSESSALMHEHDVL